MSSTQYYDLSLVPESSIVRVHASQWDNGERKFIFTLYDENGLYTVPSGAVIELRATKADNHGYAVSSYESPEIVSYDGAQVTVVTERQMCAAEGEQDFKLSIRLGSKLLASARYTLVIDADTLSDETDVSDSFLPSIISLATEQMEAAAASATLAESFAKGGTNSRTGEDTDNAKYYKEGSEAACEDSEAWARGTRNGTNVESGDETYHNNSKYFSELSETSARNSASSATSANTSEENAEAWANGTKNGVEVDSSEPQYHNNAKFWSDQIEEWKIMAVQAAADAEDSAELAESYKNDAHDYADRANTSANLAGYYANILVPTFYIDFDTMELYQNDLPTTADVTFALDANNNLIYTIASA